MFAPHRFHLGLESLDQRIVPAVVDLTAFGSSAFLGNGSVVHRNDDGWDMTHGDGSHGTGDLNKFLSIVRPGSGMEQGYNTDSRPLQFNELSDPSQTHSLQLGDVPLVTVSGIDYREFVLNVNESGNNRDISIDEARVFLGSVGNLSGYSTAFQTLAGQSAVWDLDAGEDTTVIVRAMMNQGTRVGEMVLLVPNSAFNGAADDTFVYFYTKMGATPGAAANGAAEQWGVRTPPITQPPTESGELSGYVYQVNEGWMPGDQNFLAIEGVTIELYDFGSGGLVASVTTDVNGFFRFENLAAGDYILVQNFDESFPFPPLQDYAAFAQESGTVADPNEILVSLADDQIIGGFYFTETISGS